MENRIVVKLPDGKEIVAEFCDYDGNHPEIAVCIQENGIAIQDVCIIRPYKDESDVECLVWANEYSEDYTHRFVIPQYKYEED